MASEELWQKKRFDWRPVFASAVLTSFFLTLLSLAPVFDFWTMAYVLLFGPSMCLLLLSIAAVRKSWTIVAVALSFVVVSLFVIKEQSSVRDSGRWLLGSGAFKEHVLAQAEPEGQGFKHLEWDGWGFADSDTPEYLVYDPQDRLRNVERSGFQGRWNADLCGIWQIRRLERGWYSVVFYTDTLWGGCE